MVSRTCTRSIILSAMFTSRQHLAHLDSPSCDDVRHCGWLYAIEAMLCMINHCLELTAAGCRIVGLRRRSISPNISGVEGNVALSKLH